MPIERGTALRGVLLVVLVLSALCGCEEAANDAEDLEDVPTVSLVVDSIDARKVIFGRPLDADTDAKLQSKQWVTETFDGGRFIQFYGTNLRGYEAVIALEIEIECHIQTDIPVEQDTFFLVEAQKDGERLGGDLFVITQGNHQSNTIERLFYVDCLSWLEIIDRLTNTIYHQIESSYNELVDMRVLALPPPDGRQQLLPLEVSYDDKYGDEIEKELLTGYVFNDYRVGASDAIVVDKEFLQEACSSDE